MNDEDGVWMVLRLLSGGYSRSGGFQREEKGGRGLPDIDRQDGQDKVSIQPILSIPVYPVYRLCIDVRSRFRDRMPTPIRQGSISRTADLPLHYGQAEKVPNAALTQTM
jgi:hypothetical protein